MHQIISFRSVLFCTLILFLTCSENARQGVWKTISFMDCENQTHKVSIKLSSASYDAATGFLRVDGAVKNRLKEYRLFNVRNWVYRLNEKGTFLKPRSVGLPSLPLKAMKADGTSYPENFILIYQIGPDLAVSNIILDYADQFFMTGQINRIILSIPLIVESGTVTSRG